MKDARGLECSSGSPKALDAYEAALTSVNLFLGDPIELMDEGLADSPDFIMGHVLKAHVFITLWERAMRPHVKAALTALAPFAATANPREQGHIAALNCWVQGDWQGYQSQLDQLLAAYPRDLLALQIGHNADFNLGDRQNLRGRIARALPHWQPAEPSFGILQGMYAFGLEENGDYAQAEQHAQSALTLQPEDCWARHALAHVLEMQGRRVEGITVLKDSRDSWAQAGNNLQGHVWWHLALFHLDEGEEARALQLYDDRLAALKPPFQVRYLDGASLLWRMDLLDLDLGDRWQGLAGAYSADNEAGHYPFYDIHAVMALAATKQFDAARARLDALKASAEAAPKQAQQSFKTGLQIGQGLLAFAEARYSDAVTHLLAHHQHTHIIGGSNAQRDVLHRTLCTAAERDNQHSLLARLNAAQIN